MVRTADILRAWGRILQGRKPSLSIEITKECPLRCPGCYAYSDGHVGDGLNLRQLSDLKGDALVEGVLAVADHYRPLHLSLVGGDPLVRYRELEVLLPQLLERGIFVQVVTSAFRPLPAAWAGYRNLELVVSIDGLQPEHDVRRAPATYERIRGNIRGQQVVVHCTITSVMVERSGSLEAFVAEWSANPDIKKIWMSIFTPQRGSILKETPSPAQRTKIIAELRRLRGLYPKLDMRPGLIAAFEAPPASPRDCVFARTTQVLSADLKTAITPCQFGGNPDCSQCGCIASMGLAAVAEHRLPGGVRVGAIFDASLAVGDFVARHGQRAA